MKSSQLFLSGFRMKEGMIRMITAKLKYFFNFRVVVVAG